MDWRLPHSCGGCCPDDNGGHLAYAIDGDNAPLQRVKTYQGGLPLPYANDVDDDFDNGEEEEQEGEDYYYDDEDDDDGPGYKA